MTESDFHKTPTLFEFAEEGLPPPLPKEIGGYKIESLLSKGGMSLLYLGIHPQTHEPLTIKVLSNQYLVQPEIVKRFLQEAEIIELTNHPNIVKLHGHGRWAEGLYIAMEFIQGLSLRQMILQQTMSLKRALEVILQIAHAISHLHAHGIIHRDLKPENILLTGEGGVKVIDFGIAALYDSEMEKKTRKKRIMGTPSYMSPEQREDPANVTFTSDIFSLGVITYELILGRLSHGVLHLALMPKGLQKILNKALQPDPKERYEDIIDFIGDISAYLTSEELKRDMRGIDYLGELSENLKEAQNLVVTNRIPTWPRTEIAIASNCNTAISSVYYDFFQVKNGVYSIVIGESIATGVEGLLYIAMLRGMIRSLNSLIESPKELVMKLNHLVMEENEDRSYSLAYLTLLPNEDRFSYISCGYSPLWYHSVGADAPRRLAAENLALGLTHDFDILEVESNWNVGDSVLLHTFQAGLSKSVADLEFDEEVFLDSLRENLHLPTKQQVESIFRNVTKTEAQLLFERPITLIGVERTG